MGIAKPIPSASARIAVLMPITAPRSFNSQPRFQVRSKAIKPHRAMPSNTPAPPILRIPALMRSISFKWSKSAPIRVPNIPPAKATEEARGSAIKMALIAAVRGATNAFI